MKRTFTAIAFAMGTAGITAGPAMAASSIDWKDATKAEDMTVQGMVIGVNADVGTFTLDSDRHGSIIVSVDQMSNNPLDEKGRVQLERGDNVSANGLLGRDVADQWVMEATEVSLFVDETDTPNE